MHVAGMGRIAIPGSAILKDPPPHEELELELFQLCSPRNGTERPFPMRQIIQVRSVTVKVSNRARVHFHFPPWVKFMGQILGQLISNFEAKLRDIDIHKMTVSLIITHTVCTACSAAPCAVMGSGTGPGTVLMITRNLGNGPDLQVPGGGEDR